ncbi:MAG: phosphohydrolase, partial [Flavobacteriales bacterium]|nr:phosphohydrolase [Flavobacteriales bacterium]
ELISDDKEVFTTPALFFFLEKKCTKKDFENNPDILHQFAKLDDHDIISALKQWQNHNDFVLSTLSKNIINRQLLKIEIQNKPFSQKAIFDSRTAVMKKLNLNKEEVNYFVFSDKVSNSAYNYGKAKINILMKDGSIKELKDASDQLSSEITSRKVNKFFVCYPDLR